MVSKLLRLATPTLRDVAQWVDLSYHTVRAYANDARTPPPKVRRKLARAMRTHAKRIARAADALERTAARDT